MLRPKLIPTRRLWHKSDHFGWYLLFREWLFTESHLKFIQEPFWDLLVLRFLIFFWWHHFSCDYMLTYTLKVFVKSFLFPYWAFWLIKVQYPLTFSSTDLHFIFCLFLLVQVNKKLVLVVENQGKYFLF